MTSVLAALVVLLSLGGGIRVFATRRLDFVGGAVLGYGLFVGGPCLQLLLFGEVRDRDLGLSGVAIETSLELVSYLVLGGLAAISLLFLPKPIAKPHRTDSIGELRSYLVAHATTYLVLAITVFWMSGKHSGGHWMESNRDMYAQGFLPSVIGNFYNVLRVCLPAVVLWTLLRGAIGYRIFLLTLIGFCAFDLVVASNRIVVLFALIAMVIGCWATKRRAHLLWMGFLLPVLLQFNSAFPVVRGMMWNEGASFGQVADAVLAAKDSENRERGLERVVGSAFESSSLLVTQYVMDTYGRSNALLYGETMFLKPIAFFLPRAVFPYKPEGLNTRIGWAVRGNDVLSLNSTLLGEAYANFGWLGPFFFLLFCAGFSLLARTALFPLLHVEFFFVAIAAWRFEYSFAVIGAFVLLVFFATFRFAGRFKVVRHGS
jgi:hypothetical protein